MKNKRDLRIAVDIGGTFTDSVLVTAADEVLSTAKTLTTHDDPTAAAHTGVRQIIEQAGVSLGDVTGFVHGTTLATNALIERRGACVASITTEGFRDILEIAYERRYSQYDIDLDKPDLIVPRARCFTVPERISAQGAVIAPLAEAGFETLNCAEIDRPLDNYGQGELTPEEVFELGLRADDGAAEAIVLSCTDLRSVETIERLEAALDKPVVSSNQAMLFEALQAIGLDSAEVNYGRLFRRHQAV